MGSPSKIKLASRAYDGVLPILRGQLGIPGFEFEIVETEDVPGMFSGMFRGQYDVSEMSLGELIYYTSRNKADFVAIPVFPSRVFRHGFIFIRKDSNINRPADLNGKKIGFLRWVQTASIWMHGMLIDEYGVSAKETEWYVASMHHWDEHDRGATIEPRDGSMIRLMQNRGRNTSERACRALFDGEVDALGVTESQLTTLLADDSVGKLFENSHEVEASYFRKTKILPIMHVMALQKRLVKNFPRQRTALAFAPQPKHGITTALCVLWRRGSWEATESWVVILPRMRMAREAWIFGTARHIHGRSRQSAG